MSTRILRGLQRGLSLDKSEAGGSFHEHLRVCHGEDGGLSQRCNRTSCIMIQVREFCCHVAMQTSTKIRQIGHAQSLQRVCEHLSRPSDPVHIAGRKKWHKHFADQAIGDIALTSHFRSNVAVLVKAFLDRRISASFFTAVSVGSLPSSVADRWNGA